MWHEFYLGQTTNNEWPVKVNMHNLGDKNCTLSRDERWDAHEIVAASQKRWRRGEPIERKKLTL